MSKTEAYQLLTQQLRSLLTGERDLIARAANLSALLFDRLADVNWAGVYFLKDDQLVLGPFQGKPACMRIDVGKGVCGTAAQRRETVVVPDVHQFEGHIACDTASNSEIVVPIVSGDRLLGVLDVDSPLLERFDEHDRAGLEALVQVLLVG